MSLANVFHSTTSTPLERKATIIAREKLTNKLTIPIRATPNKDINTIPKPKSSAAMLNIPCEKLAEAKAIWRISNGIPKIKPTVAVLPRNTPNKKLPMMAPKLFSTKMPKRRNPDSETNLNKNL